MASTFSDSSSSVSLLSWQLGGCSEDGDLCVGDLVVVADGKNTSSSSSSLLLL